VKKSQKDYWSEGTTITAEYLIDWIRENQSVYWPEKNPMPAWFYPRVAAAIAPTVRDITTRYHRDDEDRPFTDEENRSAVARSATLRIFRIWGRIRLGDFVCRRCGGKILGEDFIFDWSGSGPYNIWHGSCYALQKTDPQPLYLHPQRRSRADHYARELEERREMVGAERRCQRRAAELRRRDRASHPCAHDEGSNDSPNSSQSDPPRADPRTRHRPTDDKE
jgi:hypothetical protein